MTTPAKRAVLIVNPKKVDDLSRFTALINDAADKNGWLLVETFGTAADDPGRQMAREALALDPDLVIVAGGDGTVRVVCSELMNTGVPVAVMPLGTGNLLARNLGIPLAPKAAAEMAFTQQPHPLDAIAVWVDDAQAPDHLVVMGGIGFDAELMDGTDPELKGKVGATAYVASFFQRLRTPARRMSYQIDDGPVHWQSAVLILLGNVPDIATGISALPDANPHDGMVTMLIGSPRGFRQWFRFAMRVVLGRRGTKAGRRIEIGVTEPTEYEFDGDTMGTGSRFVFEAVSDGLQIVSPHHPGAQQARRH